MSVLPPPGFIKIFRTLLTSPDQSDSSVAAILGRKLHPAYKNGDLRQINKMFAHFSLGYRLVFLLII